jgi:hypothetical protein
VHARILRIVGLDANAHDGLQFERHRWW